MATPYSAITHRALFRLSDSKLAQFNEADQEFILNRYLESAVADFQNKCKVDLTQRVENQKVEDLPADGVAQSGPALGSNAEPIEEGFVEDLDNEVQEILALGISYYWLSAQIMNSELLKNKLSTKDYQYFSPANLMREVQTLRDSVQKEYKHRIINYTYEHGDLALESVT